MSLEIDFFRIVDDYIRMYEEVQLPVVICDTSFNAHWFNTAAKSAYPDFVSGFGIRSLIAEFEPEGLIPRLKEEGTVRIDGAFAFSGIHLNLVPILHDGELYGVMIMMISPQIKVTPQDVYLSSKTPESFEKVVRDNIEEIFREMDIISARASMFESGWMQRSLYDIAQNSYRILRVATNISAYAQFQSRSPALVLQSADVFDLIRKGEAVMAGLAAEMGIPLSIRLPEEESLAGIDTEKFQFALLNVLHNSLYFTRHDNRVEISGDANNKRVMVTVRDRGAGISKDVLPHVFKPYFSAGHDLKPAGVGLGLPLAKMIIEAHGGKIGISSVIGKGTEVALEIPRSLFSRIISLNQGTREYNSADSFSYYYVGLMDAASTPYREKTESNEK